jgi:hypothetical protein
LVAAQRDVQDAVTLTATCVTCPVTLDRVRVVSSSILDEVALSVTLWTMLIVPVPTTPPCALTSVPVTDVFRQDPNRW